MSDHHTPPQGNGWAVLLSGKNGIRSVTLAGGVALHAINVYIINTILPSLVKDIGGEAYYSWAATIFVISSLLGASFAAKLLVHIGPRNAYIISALLFCLGTIGCASAPTMGFFLLGRLIQGLGGGFLLSLSYTMVRIVFEARLWPLALGVISGVWGISTLIGPAIGGIFDEYYHWRAAFWLVSLLAFLFSFVAYAVLPAKNNTLSKVTAVPILQLALLTILVLIISIGSTLPSNIGKSAGLVVGLGLLAVLGAIDGKVANPLLPKRSFNWHSPFFAIYGLMLGLSIAVNAAELYLPYFLQHLHDQRPLMAGYIASLMSVGWTCGTLPSANTAKRNTRFIILAAPFIALLATIVLFVAIPTHLSSALAMLAISVALLIMGMGIGAAWPHLLTRVLSLATEDDTSRASASITTVQLFSTALSASIAGTITNLAGLASSDGIDHSYEAAIALFGFIMILLILSIPTALAIFRAMRHN